MQKNSRDNISSSKHRILLKFDYELHLWWRTKVYQVRTSKSAPDWVTYWEKLGCKRPPGALTPHLYTVYQWNSSKHRNLLKFKYKLHLWWRTKGVSSTSKFAPEWATFGVKSGCKKTPRTLSHYLNTGCCWILITSFISGGERRCIKYIKICARMGELCGESRVQKSSRDIIYLSKHRILLKFDYKLNLWWRTKVYQVHQNLERK